MTGLQAYLDLRGPQGIQGSCQTRGSHRRLGSSGTTTLGHPQGQTGVTGIQVIQGPQGPFGDRLGLEVATGTTRPSGPTELQAATRDRLEQWVSGDRLDPCRCSQTQSIPGPHRGPTGASSATGATGAQGIPGTGGATGTEVSGAGWVLNNRATGTAGATGPGVTDLPELPGPLALTVAGPAGATGNGQPGLRDHGSYWRCWGYRRRRLTGTGPTGPAGAAGAAGAVGPTGPPEPANGGPGPTGAAGANRAAGPAGLRGMLLRTARLRFMRLGPPVYRRRWDLPAPQDLPARHRCYRVALLPPTV